MDKLRCGFVYANGIHESASEAFCVHLHDIAILQMDVIAEAQAIGAKEMHVDIFRPAVRLKFEMMMLNVLQAVAHFGFAGAKGFSP